RGTPQAEAAAEEEGSAAPAFPFGFPMWPGAGAQPEEAPEEEEEPASAPEVAEEQAAAPQADAEPAAEAEGSVPPAPDFQSAIANPN
ncbi:hypothetical protein ABTE85_21625, partial [Acinetobacter baumannii]